MTSLSTRPYKGTRDYFPPDKFVQNYIFSIWKQVVEQFGYEEYGAPMLEPLEVYAAKSGQELVNDQTYTFTDRGDRQVSIRPEMTPSISRMVAERRQELAYPARLYSIANFMRYERPQKGREREFWQLNVDIFGADSIRAEVEIIGLANAILHAFGANNDDYVIKINHRQLVDFIMAHYLELNADQSYAMIKLLDRKDKISEDSFYEQAKLIAPALSGELEEKLHNILSAKTLADLPAEVLESRAISSIQALFTLLEQAGVTSAMFDISLMRGLDYYTGIVFEVNDTNPDNRRAMFGGGRYDGLVGLFGAEPISAVGMAPGLSMLEEFLAVRNLLPPYLPTTKVMIITLPGGDKAAQAVATSLRAAGINVAVDITGRRADKQIKAAAKAHVPQILFVGEAEASSGVYQLKDISSGQSQQLTITQLIRQFGR